MDWNKTKIGMGATVYRGNTASPCTVVAVSVRGLTATIREDAIMRYWIPDQGNVDMLTWHPNPHGREMVVRLTDSARFRANRTAATGFKVEFGIRLYVPRRGWLTPLELPNDAGTTIPVPLSE